MADCICDTCHWRYDKPGYSCINIGESGWEYWAEHGKAPATCAEYCKAGEYVPTGVWAAIGKVVDNVADMIEKGNGKESEPVLHARWIDGQPYTNSHWKVCSACHASGNYPSGFDNYCPHCGAKMDGKEGDT